MEQKIAMLRGINVGGKQKILMADLRILFGEMGFLEVMTYIQSGNVLFKSSNNNSIAELEDTIEESIAKRYGFNVPVIIRTAGELKEALQHNLFVEENDIDRLHITFLKVFPNDEDLEKIKMDNLGTDKFVIYKKDIFVYCTGKYHVSKLTNKFFEGKLKVKTTTRNWRTMLKLSALASH